MKNKKVLLWLLAITFTFVLAAGGAYAGHKDRNMKNPCNPCGKMMKTKNPCNPCNPCQTGTVKSIRKNNITDYSKLVRLGKKLWADEKLGKSGLSCMTCHEDHQSLNLDKAGPFPHYVKMPNDIVTLDQMINFCMINPMQGKMIRSESIRITAMAAYYQEFKKSYKGAKNVCNPCNPCGKKMKNPCNPCSRKMKNPCNPCSPRGRR